jgi:hypothetical protein
LAAFGSNSISTSGNVTAGYHIGNGSRLTSLTGANVTGTVANATYATSAGSATTAAQANYANIANSVSGSNVSGSVAQANYANIANSVAGGNVTGQVGNALVAGTVYTAAQPNITSVGTLTSLSSSGNITASYFLGNGSQLTGLPATYGNSNVVTLLAAFGSNTISTSGNVTVGNLTVSGTETDTGNITGGNLITGGVVSATGNIAGNYILGNIASSTGTVALANLATNVTFGNSLGNSSSAYKIPFTSLSNGGNSQLQLDDIGTGISYIPSTGTLLVGVLSATGNITAGNITATNLGNISSLNLNGNSSTVLYGNGVFAAVSGSGSTYGNSNVVTLLASFGSNTISTSGNVTVGNLTVSGTETDTGNITGGNLLTGGMVSATGNITGNYIFGNGSQLTGIAASYGNSNVTTLMANFGSNTISTTGNITAGNLTITGTETDTGNITGGNILTSGVVSATGRITAGAVTYANTDGTNGQVLTTYGNGITYFSTVSGGGGSLSGNLAGNLIANGYAFTSSSNGNIIIQPNGTGTLNTYGQTLNTFNEVVYAYGSTGAATITPDIKNGSIQTFTLTGNITLNTIANIQAGQSITLILKQDSTGSRLLTSSMLFSGGFKTLSTTANAIDIITVFYDGTNYYASLSRSYS